MKKTPFFEVHKLAGAKMVPFAGFEMPVQYSGIKKEHMAVREDAGLFDVSHMGEFFVRGEQAVPFLQRVTVNDVSKLFPGRAQYSAMCKPDGGIIDDLIVYCIAENEFMLVVNASNIDKDFAWLQENNAEGVELENKSDDYCLLALQGPKAADILASLTSTALDEIKYYHFAMGDFAGTPGMIISATGYTGEKGFELYFDKNVLSPEMVWNSLMEKGTDFGLIPTGLGARDTLRLEMGFALYGNDITEETNTIEAGLGWITKFDKGDFVGSDVAKKAKEDGVSRKLVGFVTSEARAIPRQHYTLTNTDGTPIGEVTSGGQSIIKGIGIGMGYVEKEYSALGTTIGLDIRGKIFEATITKPPFIK